jgi:hypothetical protein
MYLFKSLCLIKDKPITFTNINGMHTKMNKMFTVYADASDSCNQLNFQMGPTGIDTTIPTRQWNIKVSNVYYTSCKILKLE